jgi:hypothetical protein
MTCHVAQEFVVTNNPARWLGPLLKIWKFTESELPPPWDGGRGLKLAENVTFVMEKAVCISDTPLERFGLLVCITKKPVQRHLPARAGGEKVLLHYVQGIYEDVQGVLWMGTSEGLNRVDRQAGRYTSHTLTPVSGVVVDAITIAGDRSGNIWIGTL